MAERMSGVLCPVVTPFNDDLSPDPDRLIRQCQWLLTQNVGLAVFGTNSEANSLSLEEKMMLLDCLVEAGVDTNRMMPGTGFYKTVKQHWTRRLQRSYRRTTPKPGSVNRCSKISPAYSIRHDLRRDVFVASAEFIIEFPGAGGTNLV